MSFVKNKFVIVLPILFFAACVLPQTVFATTIQINDLSNWEYIPPVMVGTYYEDSYMSAPYFKNKITDETQPTEWRFYGPSIDDQGTVISGSYWTVPAMSENDVPVQIPSNDPLHPPVTQDYFTYRDIGYLDVGGNAMVTQDRNSCGFYYRGAPYTGTMDQLKSGLAGTAYNNNLVNQQHLSGQAGVGLFGLDFNDPLVSIAISIAITYFTGGLIEVTLASDFMGDAVIGFGITPLPSLGFNGDFQLPPASTYYLIGCSTLTDTPPSISASPNPCIIANGASSCSSTITWDASSLSAKVFLDGGSTFAYSSSGTSEAKFIPYGSVAFNLVEVTSPSDWMGKLLSRVTVSGVCATEDTWDGTKCTGTSPEPTCANGGLTEASCPTGTWSYSADCPTACGTATSTQTQVCSGGNNFCSGTVSSRSCSATDACAIPMPDLTAGDTTITPPSPIEDQLVAFSGVISNIGKVTASRSPGFPNTFQIVKLDPTSSTQIPLSDGTVVKVSMASLVRKGASPVISSLAVNASSPAVSTSYTFPTVGTYAVRLCANINTDWNRNDSADDSNPGNDCGAWEPVVVSSAIVTVPSCGTANAHVFASGATGYDTAPKGYYQCPTGSVSMNQTFPELGGKVAWLCSSDGTYNGSMSIPCATSRCASGQVVVNGVCTTAPPLVPIVPEIIPSADACGTGSGTTPQDPEPTGAVACEKGTLNASSPADTTTTWKWSCGSLTTCSAPKYGCTITSDSHYNASGPANDWGCSLVCENGAADYPTCTPPPGECTAPLTKDVKVACDANTDGVAASSGEVTRRQVKSAYPACEFPAPPITVDNSAYVSDDCVYPPPATTAGVCSATHYDCTIGESLNNVNDVNAYHWTCTGTDGIPKGCTEAKVGSCTAPLTKDVKVACDANAAGVAASSGEVTRRQTKSDYPACAFPEPPVTADNSTYVSDNCVYPPPALAVSCSGSPASPYIGQSVTWDSSVSGGSSSYIFEWSGTDDLYDTVPTFTKSYTTAGLKQASLTVTDSTSGKTATAACTSVATKSCTATLTATPSTVEQGLSANLTWSVSDGALCASSCSGSGFVTGGRISGSATVWPDLANHNYTLTCDAGTYGPPPPANATIAVLTPDVVVTINDQTTPPRVDPTKKDNVTIKCTPANPTVDSCVVTKSTDPSWTDSCLDAKTVVDSVTTQTTYTVDCVNSEGVHVKKSAVVNAPINYKEF
ncbi:MAG: PKD domain-containing protein [Candidatus Paceibacterota bacterium]|jgi:hypothetical protein